MSDSNFDFGIDLLINLNAHVKTHLGEGFVTDQINEAVRTFIDLKRDFVGFKPYELVVSNTQFEDEVVFRIQLSDTSAGLILTGQKKGKVERTREEQAEMFLLAYDAQNRIEKNFGIRPDLDTEDVRIRTSIPND